MMNIVYATAEPEVLRNPFVTAEPGITGNLFVTGSNEAPVIGTGTWENWSNTLGVKPFPGGPGILRDCRDRQGHLVSWV